MSYLINAPHGADLTKISSGKAEFALGTRTNANDGVYQYVSCATAAIAVNSLVKINNAFAITVGNDTNLASAKVHKLGVVTTAFPAGTTTVQYGWVFVGPGLVTVLCAASCVQDVQLLTTNVDGVVDDAGTSNIMGLKLITTITGAAASACVATHELSTIN